MNSNDHPLYSPLSQATLTRVVLAFGFEDVDVIGDGVELYPDERAATRLAEVRHLLALGLDHCEVRPLAER